MDSVVRASVIFFFHTLPLLQKAVFGLIFDGKVATVKVSDFFLQVLHAGFVHKLEELLEEGDVNSRLCFLDYRLMRFSECCAMFIPRSVRNVAVGLAS